MPCTASSFQRVLRLVKRFWLQSFADRLVNGQLALPCDEGREALWQYVAGYYALSRTVSQLPLVAGYYALGRTVPQLPAVGVMEWQARGTAHIHYLVWEPRNRS
jgi:hypothetical protein